MESYVDRKEFEALKEEVKEIKLEMTKNADLLQSIDKKIDIINEKILNTKQMEELKLNPLKEKIEKIENNNSWLWRTITATIIGLAIEVLFNLAK
jgi:predicted  nucleic acid-binding Zn-ribbon protein